jgi:hypothetical protein
MSLTNIVVVLRLDLGVKPVDGVDDVFSPFWIGPQVMENVVHEFKVGVGIRWDGSKNSLVSMLEDVGSHVVEGRCRR